jgi:hypothetical protein
MLFVPIVAAGAVATLVVHHGGKESYTDPASYVPWILVLAALVLVTMAVRAMSPIINVLIAAAIIWYVWKVPTVKTMTQNALQEISTMMPAAAPAAAPAAPAAAAPAAPAAAAPAVAP